ncbi:MAG: DUF4012 domain-containing protein [Patescibacteria group bacterium]|jgi:hypothetical protein
MPQKSKEKAKKIITSAKRLGRKRLSDDNLLKESKSEPEISLNIELGQKIRSAHIVNLKNPYQELFEKNLLASTAKPKSEPISQIKPPKMPPKKNNNKIGVDFIGSKNLMVASLKKPLAEQPPKEDQVEKSGELKKTISSFEEQEIEDIFAKPSYIQISSLQIPTNWHKKVAVFILMAIVLILPLQAFTYYEDLQDTKDRVLLLTNEAIENLKQGEQAVTDFDLNGANASFGQAKNNFISAQKEINDLNLLSSDILKLLPDQNRSVSSGLALLSAGQIIAETGQILISGGQKIIDGKNLKGYYESLAGFQGDLKTAINKFNEAKIKIQSIKVNDLPAEHRETFTKVLADLPKIESGLKGLYDLNTVLLKILGQNQWQRYLVIFLNNNELRGGGGFMGSFALADIDQGEIKKLDIPPGGTYDLQGALVPKVISPEPLHLINSRWEFQDANWWPDFPTTAKKIEWFYQNASGPSVDGVITLTSTVMEKLLAIFGPIPMPEYGRDITSQNFVAETQKIVEIEYDKKENKPKQFIADLAPILLNKLFSADGADLKKLFEVFKSSLNEKQLLIYFNDYQTEKLITDLGWAGEIKKTNSDYLSVVHTNLAGGKTDGVVKETIEHAAEVQSDGSIIDTVKVTRRHTGTSGENIFTGVQNNSYVRFYVPLGSTLLAATGFKKPMAKFFESPLPEYQSDSDLLSVETEKTKDEKTDTDIYKESGKTVFGNWLQLKPGEIQSVTIKYRLPFKIALEGQNTFYYSLLAQKQAGSLGSDLSSYLKLNNGLKPLAKFPPDLASDDSGVSFKAKLNTDQFYGAALAK